MIITIIIIIKTLLIFCDTRCYFKVSSTELQKLGQVSVYCYIKDYIY